MELNLSSGLTSRSLCPLYKKKCLGVIVINLDTESLQGIFFCSILQELKPGCHLHKYARVYMLVEHLEKFLNFMQA